VDTTVQFNMMAGAFTGGNGDYVTLFEPTATQVEQAGKGYILASIGQESGEIPYTAYFASQSYIEGHPIRCSASPTPWPGGRSGYRTTPPPRWPPRPSPPSSPTPP
jgi:hypothetical protein